MATTIDIGLIQNKYTDFIVYDETQRCLDNDYISLDEISSIILTFNGPEVVNNKIYRFDSTMQGKITPYDEFEKVTCSGYLEQKSLILNVDGTTVIGTFEEDYNDADKMKIALDAAFATLDISFTSVGGYIYANTTNIGTESYISVLGGELLDYLNWNIGIYRGNDFSWDDNTISQKDFVFTLSVEDFGYVDENEIPETYWNIQYDITYNAGLGITTYTDDMTEFSYKQTEIYRAEMFEFISRNFTEFLTVDQRWQTDMELFMQKSIYFDSLYKSFLASIDIGNIERSYELLTKIIDYKSLNELV